MEPSRHLSQVLGYLLACVLACVPSVWYVPCNAQYANMGSVYWLLVLKAYAS
jgi:hypothetical protein